MCKLATKIWEHKTNLLFILAVFLAWPTFGLSFLVLLGWISWVGYSRARKAEKRKVNSVLLEAIFERDPTDQGYKRFILALDLPVQGEARNFPDPQLKQCGRLVMLYFAHNPGEAKIFIEALNALDPDKLVSPAELLQLENEEHQSFIWGFHSRDLRLVCFRAVEALMTNNDLPCFEPYDLKEISEQVTDMSMEQKRASKRADRTPLTGSKPVSKEMSARPSMEMPHKSNPLLNKVAPERRFSKVSPRIDSSAPVHPKKMVSIDDYIAAQDAENGTNMSVWLNIGKSGVPKTTALIEGHIKMMVAQTRDFAVFDDIKFESAYRYAIGRGAKAATKREASTTIEIEGKSYFVVFTKSVGGGTIIGVEDSKVVQDRLLNPAKMKAHCEKQVDSAISEFRAATRYDQAVRLIVKDIQNCVVIHPTWVSEEDTVKKMFEVTLQAALRGGMSKPLALQWLGQKDLSDAILTSAAHFESAEFSKTEQIECVGKFTEKLAKAQMRAQLRAASPSFSE